eukprot:scaffold17032_cov73-Phaeocystis_antarctica.AAC.4
MQPADPSRCKSNVQRLYRDHGINFGVSIDHGASSLQQRLAVGTQRRANGPGGDFPAVCPLTVGDALLLPEQAEAADGECQKGAPPALGPVARARSKIENKAPLGDGVGCGTPPANRQRGVFGARRKVIGTCALVDRPRFGRCLRHGWPEKALAPRAGLVRHHGDRQDRRGDDAEEEKGATEDGRVTKRIVLAAQLVADDGTCDHPVQRDRCKVEERAVLEPWCGKQ